MLRTEQRNPRTTHIDKMETSEMLRIIHEENLRSVEAVGEAMTNMLSLPVRTRRTIQS